MDKKDIRTTLDTVEWFLDHRGTLHEPDSSIQDMVHWLEWYASHPDGEP